MEQDKYRIIFDDGKVNMLVATDLKLNECADLINKQEKPDCYSIYKINSDSEEMKLANGGKTINQLRKENGLQPIEDEGANQMNFIVKNLFKEGEQ